jgi:hypothetical protein
VELALYELHMKMSNVFRVVTLCSDVAGYLEDLAAWGLGVDTGREQENKKGNSTQAGNMVVGLRFERVISRTKSLMLMIIHWVLLSSVGFSTLP